MFTEIKWQSRVNAKDVELLMSKNTTEQREEMSNDGEGIAGKKVLKE